MFSQTGLELLKMCGSKPNINSLNIRWVVGYQTINAQHHAQYPQKMRILLGSTSSSPFMGGGSSIEIKQTLEKGPLRR